MDLKYPDNVRLIDVNYRLENCIDGMALDVDEDMEMQEGILERWLTLSTALSARITTNANKR
jgi:hypothetical protein